jgi:hypothetical protein
MSNRRSPPRPVELLRQLLRRRARQRRLVLATFTLPLLLFAAGSAAGAPTTTQQFLTLAPGYTQELIGVAGPLCGVAFATDGDPVAGTGALARFRARPSAVMRHSEALRGKRDEMRSRTCTQ